MKGLRYSAPISAVDRLVEEQTETFLFPVLSYLGIMNDDMKQLMKLIVQRFKDHQRHQPPSSEGTAANVLKGRFKVQLKNGASIFKSEKNPPIFTKIPVLNTSLDDFWFTHKNTFLLDFRACLGFGLMKLS